MNNRGRGRRGSVPGASALGVCVLTLCWLVTAGLDWSLEEDDDQGAIEDQGLKESLRCHRRLYETEVEQFDAAGRRCWDVLKLEACWGRCDSYEITDWKFPFKHSRHPVCGFGARLEDFVELKHCEEGASPEVKIYRYVKPVSCLCRACSSSDTSCGWLPLI